MLYTSQQLGLILKLFLPLIRVLWQLLYSNLSSILQLPLQNISHYLGKNVSIELNGWENEGKRKKEEEIIKTLYSPSFGFQNKL